MIGGETDTRRSLARGRGSGRAAERRGLLTAFTSFGAFWGCWAAVLPAVRLQAHVTDGQLGLALCAIALSAVPVMPVAGRLVDRFGPHQALPAALLLFAAVLPLAALAHSLGTLVMGLVLLGLGTGSVDVVANAAAAGWERVEADRLLSVAHGAFSVGVLAGSASAGLAREAGAGPLPILATVAAAVAVCALLQPAYRRTDVAPERQARGRRLPRVLVGIGALTAGAFLCEDAIQSWSALHLERGLGAGPAVSGLGPAVFATAMAVGRLLGTPLSRRVGDARIVGGAAGLLAVGVLVVAGAPSAPVALIGLAVAGAGTSVLAPVLYSAVGARAAPGRQGADLAAVTVLGYAGFVSGPPLIGAVSAATSLPTALAGLAVVGLALAIGGPLLLSGKMGR